MSNIGRHSRLKVVKCRKKHLKTELYNFSAEEKKLLESRGVTEVVIQDLKII